MVEAITGDAIKQISALTGDRVIITNVTDPYDSTRALVGFTVEPGGGAKQFDVAAVIEKFRPAPLRTIGTAQAFSLTSFINLVNRHKGEDSAVFGKILDDQPSFTAVVDYFQDEGTNWAEHLIVYNFPISPEWKAWTAANGKAMSQIEFGQFLEDHIIELSDPTEDEREQFRTLLSTEFGSPSQIMALSRGLVVNEASRFENANVLQTGETKLKFETTHLNENGDKLTVPGLFMVAIPLFIDGAEIRIAARLRYRKAGGSLTWFYNLYRPHVVMRNRLVEDLAHVGEATALPTFEGSPEKR